MGHISFEIIYPLFLVSRYSKMSTAVIIRGSVYILFNYWKGVIVILSFRKENMITKSSENKKKYNVIRHKTLIFLHDCILASWFNMNNTSYIIFCRIILLPRSHNWHTKMSPNRLAWFGLTCDSKIQTRM